MITITPTMTVEQLGELVEQHKARDLDVYIRIESYKGKPQAFLVREPKVEYTWVPPLLRKQAE